MSYIVKIEVFAFHTEEDAEEFEDAFFDVFTTMPQTSGIGYSIKVEEEYDDDSDS